MALVKEERHHLRDTPSRRVAVDAPPFYHPCICLRIPMCNVYLCLFLSSLSLFIVFVIVFVFVLHCLMPLPSGGGSAFFLLSLHARAACDESLRCSSVGSLRSPSRFHSDTCASSSAHTHTPRLSVCNHYNATVSSAHKVDRRNRSISTSSVPLLKYYTEVLYYEEARSNNDFL